ncbi:hypothetical protein [Roseovarius autotrophicus]|uniref:hypothetical protein n=1 Tax=Roseovarius autotrophicus TaxID=2824121 RepID=UPI0019E983DA|nr:hypothetical protein [Roseovarius autotrophicus]MBE0454150.1 hypothetical protein [Roseovarius sp.]
MFKQDKILFVSAGLAGLPVNVGVSVLLFLALYLSLAFGLHPDALMVGVIVLISSLLAGHASAAAAILQGVGVRSLSIGGAGVDLTRVNEVPARDELLIAAAVPLTHLALFGFFGLASNLVAQHAAALAASAAMAEQHALWRSGVEILWLVAIVNVFLGILHLLPAYPFAGGMIFSRLLHALLPTHIANTVSGFVGLLMFVLWIPLSMGILGVGLGVFLVAPEWHRHLALMNNQPQA